MLTLALSATIGLLAVANIAIYKNSKMLKNGRTYIEKQTADKGTAFQKNELQNLEKKVTAVKTGNGTTAKSLTQMALEYNNSPQSLIAQKISTLQSDINYLDKRFEGTAKRLEKIEMGLSLNGESTFEGIKAVLDETISQKISTLEEFKRNALIEIEALKQKVYTEQDFVKKPTIESPELEEKIRNIAFNIRN